MVTILIMIRMMANDGLIRIVVWPQQLLAC